MGIRGLFTYLRDNKGFDIVDLVEDVKQNIKIEILIDFNCYERSFYELFLERINKEYDNEFLLLPGGEFDILFDAFYKFQEIFENLGIKFVWIIDGPKGIDKDSRDNKIETWIKRNQKEMKQFEEVLSCCDEKKIPGDLDNLMPFSSFEVLIACLKKAGAEVIQLLQGESDEFIAYEFHRRKSYAILSDDTDFLFFPDCKVIFTKLMNICYGKKDCNLPFFDYENPGNLFKSPKKFECPIVTPRHIMKLLKLQNHNQLLLLTILNTNDNTTSCFNQLRYRLGLTDDPNKNAQITKIAKFILDNQITSENILDFEPIKAITKQNPQLSKGINYCIDFYSLKRIKENIKNMKVTYRRGTIDDPLTDYLAENFSNLTISKIVYSAHFGIISEAICSEEQSSAYSLISSIMDTINSQTFPYIYKEGLRSVTKWNIHHQLYEVPVIHAIIKTNKIHSNRNVTHSTVSGIDLFEKIWSHLEPSGCLHYVNKLGLDRGFICYILRYLYRITKYRKPYVLPDEFRALFISVFYHYSLWKGMKVTRKLKRESFLRLKICPSPKCFIINSIFLRIFCTAKYLCGGAFNLTEEFPSIENIFSGSVFYAFYETANESNGRVSHLTEDLKKYIADLDSEIMEINEEIYLDLIDKQLLLPIPA